MSRLIRRLNTSLTGSTENFITTNIDSIIEFVRQAYFVIEKHDKADGDISVNKVMADFRKAINGDALMRDSVNRTKEVFPLRAELVNVGDDQCQVQTEMWKLHLLENVISDYVGYFSVYKSDKNYLNKLPKVLCFDLEDDTRYVSY